MTPIDTGYKPEFALGALYQGWNAADAQQSNQLELIKQALANQREQQVQPLDVENKRLTNQGMVFDNMVKDLAGAQAKAQNTPEMLQIFLKDKQAGYNKNIRQDEIDSLLQPFKKEMAPLQGQRMVNDADSDASLSTMQNEIINMQPGPQRDLLQKRFTDATGTRAFTPEQAGKEAIEGIKGGWHYDSAVDAAKIHAAATRDAAQAGGKAAWAQAIVPATQEVSKIRELLTKLNNNELADEIAARVRMSGKRPGTKEYQDALVSEKDVLRTQLMQQYQQAHSFLQQVQQASGIGNTPQPQQATYTSLAAFRQAFPQYNHLPDSQVEQAAKAQGLIK